MYKIIKFPSANKNMNFLADIAYSIAEMEEKLFSDLRQWVKAK